MRNIIATFTEAERNIIVFVLVTLAAGCGLVQWRESRASRMTFSAADAGKAQMPRMSAPITPAGMDQSGRVSLNTADGPLIETLPGIGPALAGAILRHREANGPFRSMDDLDNVPGIGPAMMTKLAGLVSFDGATSGGQTGGAAQDLRAVAPPGAGTAPAAISSGMLAAAPGQIAAGNRININTASADQLDQLNGVGPALAQRIILDRQQRGAFRSVAELDRVKGIGPSILQKNAAMLTVE
jgi:competence protein ComEA